MFVTEIYSYSILPVDEQAEIHEEDNLSGDEFMDDSEGEDDELEDMSTSSFAHEQPMHVLPLYSLLSSDKQAKVSLFWTTIKENICGFSVS